MDDWIQAKERTRSFFKSNKQKPFIGWDKATIAPYKIEKRSKLTSPTSDCEIKSIGGRSSLFRFVRGEKCVYCEKLVTDEPLKDHVKRAHPNGRRCTKCEFVTVDGFRGIQEHYNDKHRVVIQCAACNRAHLTSESFEKHNEGEDHKRIVCHQIKLFNRIVDSFQLPVKKLTFAGFEEGLFRSDG